MLITHRQSQLSKHTLASHSGHAKPTLTHANNPKLTLTPH